MPTTDTAPMSVDYIEGLAAVQDDFGHIDVAKALRAQQARIAELEAALRPFAEADDRVLPFTDWRNHIKAPLLVAHLRAAKAALEG